MSYQDVLNFQDCRYYMLRITPEKSSTKTRFDVFDLFKSTFDELIVAEEISNSGRLHFHCLLGTSEDDKIDMVDVREIVRVNFGKGNSKYSLKLVETPRQAMSYTIKDKKYTSQGFSLQQMKILEDLSFQKFNKLKFTRELTELEFKFRLRMITPKQFFDNYVDIRLNNGLNYPTNTQLQYIKRMYAMNYPKFKQELNSETYNRLTFEITDSNFR